MEINVGGKKGLSGFGRVLFVLLALVLIFFVARTVALQIAGEETVAEITNVTRKEESRGKAKYDIIITQTYKYSVDGKEYTGSQRTTVSDSQRTRDGGMYPVRVWAEKSSQKSVKITYLPMFPQFSNPTEGLKLNAGNVILMTVLTALAVVLLVFAFRPNKKKAAAVTTPPGGYVPRETGNAAQSGQYGAQTGQAGQTGQAAGFCPHCGAQNAGGTFCPFCGGRLDV